MKRLLLAFFVLIVLLVVGGLTLLVKARWEVAKRLDAIRKSGDPVSMLEVDELRSTNGVNAADYLRNVMESGEAFQKKTDAILNGPGFTWDGQKMPAVDLQALKLEVGANPDVFEAFRLAAQSDRYDWDIDYSVGANALMQSEFIASTKRASRLASARTRSFAAMGKPEVALNCCLDHLKLSLLVHEPPMILGFTISSITNQMAMDDLNALLQTCEFSQQTRERIDQELALVKMERPFVYALKSERAFGLDQMQSFGMGLAVGLSSDEIGKYAEVFDKELKMGLADPSKVNSPAPTGNGGTYGQLVIPAIKNTRKIAYRIEATARCLRILNRIRGQVQSGVDPGTITIDSLELKPTLVTDPYDGNQIKIKFNNDDWTIYCVGLDKKDDGGLVDNEENNAIDVGVGPVAVDAK